MEAFLKDERVNTVYIATPNLLHYEQTKMALLVGKHVICEKPFVTKYSQAEELLDLAKEKHLLLIEAAPTTYLPNYEILKEKLERIGKIRLVLSNYSQYSSRYDALLRGEKPNIFNPEFAGGCIMDINFYNILLNIALFGKPEEASYFPNIYPGLGDTSGVVLFKYKDFVSTNAGAKDTWGINYFQIEGEEGYIYIENGSNGLAKIRLVTKTSDETFNEQLNPDRWFYEVKKLTELLLNEAYDEVYAHLKTTLMCVEVMELVRKKAGLIFPGDD